MIMIIVMVILFKIFKLSSYLISYILKEVKIILPLNKDDCLMLKEKQKQMKNKIVTSVRSCEVAEYVEVKNDSFTQKSEFLTFFTFISIMANLAWTLDNYLGYQAKLNIASSLSFLVFIYVIYTCISGSHNTKRNFSLLFFALCIVLYSSLYLDQIGLVSFPKIINFKYNETCKHFNSKLNDIMTSSPDDYKALFSFKCTYIGLKIGYIGIFSFITASLYKAITREAYYEYSFTHQNDDHFNIGVLYKTVFAIDENKSKSSFLNSFSYRKLKVLYKIKMILCLIIFALLVDFISYDELSGFIQIPQLIYQSIILVLICIEILLGLSFIRYKSMSYLGVLYPLIHNFQYNDEQTLQMLKIHMNNHNDSFWGIYDSYIILALCPLLAFLTFINRSDLFSTDYSLFDVVFKKYIFENIFYIILLSFYFTKGVLNHIYIFYIAYIMQTKPKEL